MTLEKQLRLPEASKLCGYSVAALRKKLRDGKLGIARRGGSSRSLNQTWRTCLVNTTRRSSWKPGDDYKHEHERG